MDHRDEKHTELAYQLCELAVMRVNRHWKERINFLWNVIAIEPQKRTNSIRSTVRTKE